MNGETDIFNLIHALEDVSGTGVCLYDSKHFFSYYYGAISKNNTGHYCPFCRAVRDLPGGREACIRCDVEQVWNLAQRYRTPFFNVCHAGLCENIVPLRQGETLLGVLFLGQCVVEPEVTFESVYSRIEPLHAGRERFRVLFEQLPHTQRHMLTSAGVLAQFSLEKLLSGQTAFLPEEQPDVVRMAQGYIESNYQNELSLRKISGALHVSPAYLSRRFRCLTGSTLTDYIIETRIRQAKKLLTHSDIPIQHISMNVGFENANYFSRVFKRQTGQSPGAFRRASAE